MLNECFMQGGQVAPLAAGTIFREEGRGLGFSIGGWHPFRINTYLPTLKKLDPLANTSLGRAVWKPIEKVNQSVNKDFMKGKSWSQDHRKQLQIAAAIALAAVGGMYAAGYLGTEGAAGAAASAGAEGAATTAAGAGDFAAGIGAVGGTGEAVTTATLYSSETLAPLAVSSGSGLSLVPATVGASAPVVTGSTFGSLLGGASTVAKDLGTLSALSKLVGMGGQPQQAQPVSVDGYGAYSPMGFTGQGGGLGPMGPMGPPDNTAPQGQVNNLPSWVVPAAGLGLLYLLVKE